MRTTIVRIASAVSVALVLAFALSASARPRPGWCECAPIDAPVLCSNGIVYSSACVAGCAGATGCVPYGPQLP